MGWFTEVFFYRLIVSCDDYGRMDARPAILRAKLFPLRVEMGLETVRDALAELAAIGCVRLYEVAGRPYLCLPAWAGHQRIRTQRAKYPGPDEAADDVLPQPAADGGAARPESETQSQSQSESISEAEAEGAGVRAELAAAATAIGMPFAKKDAEIADELLRTYSREWVLEAIARAADGPSRTWRYIRGILGGWQATGGMDARGRPTAWPKGAVLAQQYTQRQYAPGELESLAEVF